MENEWKRYLNQFKSEYIVDKNYNYPVDDLDTDFKVLKQDPDKINREDLLISNFLNRKWKTAIDFGCGLGGKFHVFDKKTYSENFFIGIEPDVSRFKIAQNKAKKLRWIDVEIINAGIEIFESTPSNLKTDLIICIQVLGHVPKKECIKIIEGFKKILPTNGACAIAIPVIGEAFKGNIDAINWNNDSDFTHIVDYDLSPGQKGYRKHVAINEFDKIAEKTIPGKLPVRSFLLPDFPNPNSIELPYKIDKLPPTFEKIIKKDLIFDEIYLYSIHRDTANSDFPIGDLIIFFHKA